MEIIEKKIYENLYIPKGARELLENKKACFFDIETTGFSRENDSIILIGLLYFENDYIIINQFFANNPSEEKLILAAFIDLISKFDCYVTYNGDAFDIPFLNHKFRNSNNDFELSKDRSIDLLKLVRANKAILGLSDCKLKTVEISLGLKRDDTITGKESAQLYKKYTKNKNEATREMILMHNYDDIYYLPKVLKVFDYIDKRMNCEFSIPIKDEAISINFNLNDILINGDVLCVTGSTSPANMVKQVIYDTNYTFVLDNHKDSFNLKIELQNGFLSNGNKCLYINKDDYLINIIVNDTTNYNLPENIIIIKDEKSLKYDNIVSLIEDMISAIFYSSTSFSTQ